MSLRLTPVLRNVAGRRVARAAVPVARRGFSTEAPPPPPPPPPKQGGNGGLFLGLGALAAAGAGYWFYTQQDNQAAPKFHNPTQEDYQKVYNAIADSFDAENYDDGSFAPVILRLAWHASGTYDKNDGTGGSNYATMRFANESGHGGNAGLGVARDHMEKIKKEFPWISYGDLWTLGGVAAIQELGGPIIPWRPGRVDGFEGHQTPDGRLPDGSLGQKHVRDVFGRMGFNDQETVALIGAHALGRCHKDRSGFDGPWTFSPTSFTNSFFTELIQNSKWRIRPNFEPQQYEDVKTKTLMMLPTDMALATDKQFRKIVEVYAKDEDKFFQDFSKAFATLLELGVPKEQFKTEPWTIKPTA